MRRGLGIAASALAACLGARPAPADEAPDPAAAIARSAQRAIDRLAPSLVRLEVTRKPPAPKPTPDATPAPKPEPAPEPKTEPRPKSDPPRGPQPQPEAERFPGPNTPAGYFARPTGPVTGLVVDADGGILTSLYNVEGDIASIHATLADGRRLPATLLGADPNTDCAYLRVEATGLPVPVRAAAPAHVGQLVLALGIGPADGAPTATLGIVSATGRLRGTAPAGSRAGTALQVSARLNYGNTGGPIVTLAGEWLAVAGYLTHDSKDPEARKGLNSGVGFATPVTRLEALLPALRRGERIPERALPFLGVSLGPDPQGEGARVMAIVPGTPAAAAGLQPGDVVIRIGDTRIESPLDLQGVLQQSDAGDAVDLVLLRGDARTRVETKITLAARPKAPR